MDDVRPIAGGQYQWFGWTVHANRGLGISIDRLTETHEYFHRQLDDTTAFGGLITTIAALAQARPNENWSEIRDRLQDMSDVVQEVFAVGMSLLTTQRPLAPIDGYPMYDRYVALVRHLVGPQTHPWVAVAALRAAATACMQSSVLAYAAEETWENFLPTHIALDQRPNHRLVLLLNSDFVRVVQAVLVEMECVHGHEDWWRGFEGVPLPPSSMEGSAGDFAQDLYLSLFDAASASLRQAGTNVVGIDGHFHELIVVLEKAAEKVPEGLVRIGAVVETPGAELLQNGALDSQTIRLSAAPKRATVLPYGSVSGLSGVGSNRHGFLSIVRPEKLRASYELEGISIPDAPAVACLRSTIFSGESRDSVLFVLVDNPNRLEACEAPIFVSIASSAAAADPELVSMWRQSCDSSHLSLVMDTPASVALRRWCSSVGTRFRTATESVTVEGMNLRIIVGRIENGGKESELVLIPTTEFGARWFETAIREDTVLASAVYTDDELFQEESGHLDVVLSHLFSEERVVGSGSWRP